MFKPHGVFFNRDYAVNRFHCRDREGYLPFAFSKTHRLTPGGPFRIKFGADLPASLVGIASEPLNLPTWRNHQSDAAA